MQLPQILKFKFEAEALGNEKKIIITMSQRDGHQAFKMASTG